MDGRITSEPTPEGRLAAVAYSVMVQMRDHEKKDADYADYRDCLRPFVHRELILVQLEVLRRSSGADMSLRVSELAKDLAEVSVQIAHISDRFHL
jgi:hypothetical protein